ncbi:hypothetical protein DY000_02029867 [Brassica cretica]|uniref:Uncharacterized protein n=1 Tax=Brassica cretica TaxID=69181 RepID=A0ABQ7DSL5_BRACR|nr:hypothetical protein DY000_02029867 [Brassica cretica]
MEDQSHPSRKEKLRFNDHKKNQVFFNKAQSSSSDILNRISRVFFCDLKSGKCSGFVEARLLQFWEARNVKRGGELMWVDMLLVDVNPDILLIGDGGIALKTSLKISALSNAITLKRLIRKGIPPVLRPEVWFSLSGTEKKKSTVQESYYSDLTKAVNGMVTPATQQIDHVSLVCLKSDPLKQM